MNAQTFVTLVLVGGVAMLVVWFLNKIGRALTAILEALATVAMVLLALWVVVKAGYSAIKAAVTHWRTTLTLSLGSAWLLWWGWLPVVVVLVLVRSCLWCGGGGTG